MLYAPHDLYLIRSARTLASHWARQNRAESTGLPSSRPMSVSGAELPRIRARYRITQLTPTAVDSRLGSVPLPVLGTYYDWPI